MAKLFKLIEFSGFNLFVIFAVVIVAVIWWWFDLCE